MLISVITPSYNQGQFIEKTVQSVVRQDYSPFEHIVIDGGSTDQTVSILEKHSHLKWISEPDRGKSHAVNKGFRMAQGDIIGWLNADDCYRENTFRIVSDFFKRNAGAAVLAGRAEVVDYEGRFLFYQDDVCLEGLTHEGLIRFWRCGTLPQPSVFFRREVLDQVGCLNEDLWSYADYDFFLRVSRSFKIEAGREILSSIRSHRDSDDCLNIAAGLKRKGLFQISRRYWGGPMSPRYWKCLLSYGCYLPILVWKDEYGKFAYEYKEELENRFRERALPTFLWQSRRTALKYPLPFLVAGLRRTARAVFGTRSGKGDG